MIDWSKYKNFTKEEFDCSHTGRNDMQPIVLDTLQKIRNVYPKPIIVTSGYRDKSHPFEVGKAYPGEHTLGLAVDIACRGENAYHLLNLAFEYVVPRIGVSQHSTGGRFLHLGFATDGFPSPWVWSY